MEELIQQPTPENLNEWFKELKNLKDKSPRYSYLVVNPPMNKLIEQTLLQTNDYKVRLEEIAGMKYFISHHWDDKETPKAIVSVLDIGRVVAVYQDFEGNPITIEDLFDSKHKEWQKEQQNEVA